MAASPPVEPHVIPTEPSGEWRNLVFALVKQGKLQGRGVLAPEPPCLVQTPCAKTAEFGFAEFWDCTPVSALVCVFACGTGILIGEFSVS